MPTTPTDPLYAQQLFFDNLGQINGQRAIEYVWDDYTGQGIYAMVFDSGTDYTHVDLDDQYDHTRDVVINGVPEDGHETGGTHGQMIAGFIGAERNGIGVVGVAYEAEMVAHAGILIQGSRYDVVNTSYGIFGYYAGDNADRTGGLYPTYYEMEHGRGGLGTISVTASGNDRVMASQDPANNLRINIAVAATEVGPTSGNFSSYSDYGSAILVSVPGEGLSTDLAGSRGDNTAAGAAGDYAANAGTSFSSPILAGVTVLMLEANPDLGWRDVQDIVAASAVHRGGAMLAGPSGNEQFTWDFNGATTWNGGGYHVSGDYGYGEINVYNAVRIAEAYHYIGMAAQTTGNETLVTSDAASGAGSGTLSMLMSGDIDIDHVNVRVTLSDSRFDLLTLTLISPDGQEVVLHDGHFSGDAATITRLQNFAAAGITWNYLAQNFRGEHSQGTWQLVVTDADGNDVSVTNAVVEIYGAVRANFDDVYVYTDEYGAMLGVFGQSGRGVMDDAAGNNWFNGAALTAATFLDMNPGTDSSVGGTNLSSSPTNRLVGAITGDGTDHVTGNDLDNRIFGMRGNDTLSGGIGNDWINGDRDGDTLDGGSGFDVVDYDGSDAGVRVDLGAPSLDGRVGGGHAENDTLLLDGGFNSFEAVSGSDHADSLYADDRANTLWGKAGDDRQFGRGGADKLFGGRGNDAAAGGAGADFVSGGDGDDRLYGDQGYSVLANGYLQVDGDAGHGRDWRALDINALRALTPDPNVSYDTIDPHVSIQATGHGAVDCYAMEAVNGGGYIVDIDGSEPGVNFWVIVTSPDGSVIYADRDDQGAIDPGSTTLLDPFFNVDTLSTNSRIIHVGINVGGVFSPVPDGVAYTLHYSNSTPVGATADGADTLVGGRGNDELFGGGGADTLFGDQNLVVASPGVVTKDAATLNDAFDEALWLDGLFTTASNANITDSTAIGHVTVDATASGGIDWYAFTVTADDIGDALENVFDIDGGDFDSSLRLYNAAGAVLAENDDNPDLPDSGSTSSLQSYLTYHFATAGVYYLAVSTYSAVEHFAGIGAGTPYQLHVSLLNPSATRVDGNDTLDGGSGVDVMRGGGGDDTLRVRGVDDGVGETYDGGDGIDTMELYGPGSYNINLRDDNVNIDHITFDDPGAGNTARLRMLDSQMAGSWGYLSIVDFSTRANIFDLAVGIGGSVYLPIVQFDNFTLDDQILVTGASGVETITGSSVADTITGAGGADILNGVGGADIFLIGSQADHPATETIDGGNGTDRIRFTSTTAGQALVLSSHVSNVEIAEITNAAGSAAGTTALNLSAALVQQGMQLRGNAGDNILVGSAFADVMSGGAGNDKYYVANTSDTVTELVGKGSDTVYASTSWTMQAGQEIELLQANAGSTGLTLTGNSFTNAFVSGAGNDTMTGLGGNDTFYVNNGGDIVNEAVGGGADTVRASVSYTLAAGQEIENVIANAGSNALTLTGNAFGNSFTSGAGTDTLIGLGGNDAYYINNTGDIVNEAIGGGGDAISTSVSYTLKAGQEIESLTANAGNTALTLTGNEFGNTIVSRGGVDTLIGLAGDDRYFVNFALDKVTEAVGGGGDTVYASVSYTLAAGQEIEVLSANAGANGIRLTGNAFNNALVSGNGVDTLVGLVGDDTYYVNNTGDVVQEAAGGGTNDTVRVSVDYTLGANQEIERLLANAGATSLKLTGNNLNNYLLGGAGGDTLTGGLGVDSFAGAGGSDLFVFNAVAESGIATPDSILDFTAGDKVDIHLIDADGNAANGDTAFVLDVLGDNSFATGHIKQTISGSTLFLSFNTDGDSASEMIIKLLNHGLALGGGDLVA